MSLSKLLHFSKKTLRRTRLVPQLRPKENTADVSKKVPLCFILVATLLAHKDVETRKPTEKRKPVCPIFSLLGSYRPNPVCLTCSYCPDTWATNTATSFLVSLGEEGGPSAGRCDSRDCFHFFFLSIWACTVQHLEEVRCFCPHTCVNIGLEANTMGTEAESSSRKTALL